MNWCPGLGTVLANEEVTADGRSERGNFPVYRRPLKQWMLRITAYADRLLADLDRARLVRVDQADAAQLDRPQHRRDVALPGRGPRGRRRSRCSRRAPTRCSARLHGARARASARRRDHRQRVAGRRGRRRLGEQPDRRVEGHVRHRPARRPTRCTATASSPRTKTRSRAPGRRRARRRACSPVRFAINPTNDERIPIFIADYVLMGYGTGAIMAVPGQDERDCEFAREFDSDRADRPPTRGCGAARPTTATWPRRTSATASRDQQRRGSSTGCAVAEAKRAIIEWLEANGLGRARPSPTSCATGCSAGSATGASRSRSSTTTYGPIALPESMLPVELPEITDFEPDDVATIPTRCPSRRSRAPPTGSRSSSTSRPGVGGLRPRPPGVPARDEHDAAVGRVVLVLPALPRPDERGRAGRPRGRARVGDGHARRRFAEGRARRPVRRRRRARGAAPPVRALLAQGAVRPRPRVDARAVPAARATRATSWRPRTSTSAACTSRRPRSRSATARYFYDGEPVHARVRQDGQEPEERGRARRHLPRLRRRHAAALRDVHGPARRDRARGTPPTSSACTGSCSGCGATWSTRRRASRASPTTPADDETRRAAAPHDRRGARRHGRDELQHRDRAPDRAEQPPDAGRAAAAERAARGRRAAGADGRAARAAHRRGAVGAARPRRHARVRAVPDRRPALLVDDTVEVPVQVNGKVRGRITVPAGADDADARSRRARRRADRRAARRRDRRARSIVVPGRIVNFVV